MTDLIYDYIAQGVDLLITATIVSAVAMLLQSATILSSYQANAQANSERINYYKQYNKYDGTEHLCTAEVLSAILYFKGDLEIVVQKGNNVYVSTKPYGTLGRIYLDKDGVNGGNYSWSEASKADLQAFTTLFASSNTFKAQLVEDFGKPNTNNYEGGTVTGILFTLE